MNVLKDAMYALRDAGQELTSLTRSGLAPVPAATRKAVRAAAAAGATAAEIAAETGIALEVIGQILENTDIADF